jgi:hypothetical protein
MSSRRVALRLLLTLVVVAVASGHVGTSNAYYEGLAGPYDVRVIVRTPGVVPGLAQISIRVVGGGRPTAVTVQPLFWATGAQGAPPPDAAQPVSGENGLYAAELWLMTPGAYSVRVTLSGDAGEGIAFVPVNAVAERRLAMSPVMALVLICGGLFLFVGALTIVGAAVRESVVAPGADPGQRRLTRSRIAMGVGGVVLAAILWAGWNWWDTVDAAYRARMFKPLSTSASVAEVPGGQLLTLRIDDPAWLGRDWSPLVPDHGKLMHMFLLHDGDLSAFAHLHPVRADSSSFEVLVPPVPAGTYRLYADIVQENGFAQTLVDTVTIAEPMDDIGELPSTDPDDAWSALPPFPTATSTEYVLPSGRRVTLRGASRPLANQELSLDFRITEPDGTPSVLETYAGMLSHGVVTMGDGSVFMHVHPGGSIAMAAQDRFARADSDAMHDMSSMAMPITPPPGDLSFPFVFPSDGVYRVLVQVKAAGVVETAAFDIVVPKA